MPQICWIAPYKPAHTYNSEDGIACFSCPCDKYAFADWLEDGIVSTQNEEREIVCFSCPCDKFTSADWLAVMDTAYAEFETSIPKERRILFISEPPTSVKYEKAYLEQFGIVFSPYVIEDFTGRVILSNPCQGWWFGNSVFTKLAEVENFKAEKTKTISIASSLNRQLEGHVKRIVFLNAMMEHYGSKADYYGREFSPIKDKISAIAPYKYHVAIENSRVENYWTEKLADAWIGWSLPIYYGDPSVISKIPDPAGIEIIDIDDIPAALRKIDALIENDVYESRREAIEKCRKWALKKTSIAEHICEIITESSVSVKGLPELESKETIYKRRHYAPHRTLSSRFFSHFTLSYLRRKIYKIKRYLLMKKIFRNYRRIKQN